MRRPSVWDDGKPLLRGSKTYYQYYQTYAASLLSSDMAKMGLDEVNDQHAGQYAARSLKGPKRGQEEVKPRLRGLRSAVTGVDPCPPVPN